MNIAIGPIEGHYGGAAQHILNITRHSSHNYSFIALPESLKKWGEFYRKNILPLQDQMGVGLKHSDKRFDMYGIQRFLDLPGMYAAKIQLNNFDAVHLHGHPYWHQIYQVSNPNRFFTVHNLYDKRDFSPVWHDTVDVLTKNMLDVCKRSRKVISVAKWLKKALDERHGIDSIYIPNGVNLSEFSIADGERFRKKYSIEDDFYLFVGRSTKYKRPELFVELAKKMPHRLFVMVGRGLTPERFCNYYPEKLPGNLRLIGEPPREDVVDSFAACRTFILPSANETFGIVLLEGMVSGKPTIGANNLGPSEIIENGKTGYLFEPDSLDSLVEKADLAWEDKEIGFRAKEESNKYDWKNIVPQIEEIYK